MAGFQYLVSRTTRRPREVLQYLRLAHYLAVASGHSTITSEMLLKAEEEFSGWKLEHLCSEYKYVFPGVKDLLWCFRAFGPVLSAGDALEVVGSFVDGIGDSEKVAWMRSTPKELLQHLYSIDFLGCGVQTGHLANSVLVRSTSLRMIDRPLMSRPRPHT